MHGISLAIQLHRQFGHRRIGGVDAIEVQEVPLLLALCGIAEPLGDGGAGVLGATRVDKQAQIIRTNDTGPEEMDHAAS